MINFSPKLRLLLIVLLGLVSGSNASLFDWLYNQGNCCLTSSPQSEASSSELIPMLEKVDDDDNEHSQSTNSGPPVARPDIPEEDFAHLPNIAAQVIMEDLNTNMFDLHATPAALMGAAAEYLMTNHFRTAQQVAQAEFEAALSSVVIEPCKRLDALLREWFVAKSEEGLGSQDKWLFTEFICSKYKILSEKDSRMPAKAFGQYLRKLRQKQRG